jgi:flagellar biosynthesis/type III secretory pathway chaperone
MTELTRPDALVHPGEAALQAASEGVARLAELLTQEFEALKTRDLTVFESLQEEKNALLERLAALAGWATAQSPVPEVWQQLQAPLQQCKQDHLRNIQLLQRQLQAVKGTLQALQGESAPSVDLYDRMGQMAKRQGAWGQQLA